MRRQSNDSAGTLRRQLRSALSVMLLGATVMIAVGCGDSGEAPVERPNILVITLDTTRADRLSCYGYRRITSPRIDAIARAGTLFENAIAQASVTPVSHAAIFTGRNPYANGLRVLHGPVAYVVKDEVPLLAETLQNFGYTTGGFIAALPCGERFSLDRGFDHFDDPFTSGEVGGGEVTEMGVVNTNAAQRRASQVNRSVIDWLEQQPGEDPLFVWAHYFDPHDVRLLPEGGEAAMTAFVPEGNTLRDQLLWAYDNEIHYMDGHVGALVEQMGELERPLLVCIVGDHGEGLGDHDWWSHGILYQEQIRVPMILSGDRVPVGRRIDSLVRTIDVAPTILSLIGEKPRRWLGETEGVDLRPLLAGEKADLGLTAYAESVTTGMGYLDHAKGPGARNRKSDQLYSVTRGGWKYIHHIRLDADPLPNELYDLASDPNETRNLASQEPERVAEFQAWMKSNGVFFDPRKGVTVGTDMTDEMRERLRKLGYLGAEDEPPAKNEEEENDE